MLDRVRGKFQSDFGSFFFPSSFEIELNCLIFVLLTRRCCWLRTFFFVLFFDRFFPFFTLSFWLCAGIEWTKWNNRRFETKLTEHTNHIVRPIDHIASMHHNSSVRGLAGARFATVDSQLFNLFSRVCARLHSSLMLLPLALLRMHFGILIHSLLHRHGRLFAEVVFICFVISSMTWFQNVWISKFIFNTVSCIVFVSCFSAVCFLYFVFLLFIFLSLLRTFFFFILFRRLNNATHCTVVSSIRFHYFTTAEGKHEPIISGDREGTASEEETKKWNQWRWLIKQKRCSWNCFENVINENREKKKGRDKKRENWTWVLAVALNLPPETIISTPCQKWKQWNTRFNCFAQSILIKNFDDDTDDARGKWCSTTWTNRSRNASHFNGLWNESALLNKLKKQQEKIIKWSMGFLSYFVSFVSIQFSNRECIRLSSKGKKK